MLFGCVFAYADDTTVSNSAVASQFYIRSQGLNAVRRIIGSVGKVNIYDADKRYWNLSLTPEFTDSFNEKEIARCLFGDAVCDGRILKIEGSQACQRDENALLADYFYLPTDFKSQVHVKPRIQNILVDLNFHVGLDNLATGLYFWLQAPLVWTKWDLHARERIINPGVNAHTAGYFTPNALPRNQLLNNFLEYATGEAPGTAGVASNTISQFVDFEGDTVTVNTNFTPLNCSRFCAPHETVTRVAEVRAALGWNFLLAENYHLGLNIQTSAPTGNSLTHDALFAPQNGNGKHWELGAGLTAHWTFWHSEDEVKQVGIYADLNVTHLFNAREHRCFDLCGKPLSRYMLAAKMVTADEDTNLEGAGTAATHIFGQTFSPVANITETDVNVSVGAQADLVFWINYTCGNWSLDAGYNLWARSCEKIKLLGDCDRCTTFPENTWVLKGDAQVFGFLDSSAEEPSVAGDFVRLSASMSEATIYHGDNLGGDGCPTTAQVSAAMRNPNIDEPKLATATANDTPVLSIRGGSAESNQINTSIQPVFIKQEDINYSRTRGLSNKLFYNMTYTWLDSENATPYLGWGGEIEWGAGHHKDCGDCNSCDTDCNTGCETDCDSDCDTDCDNSTRGSCERCAVSQWGIWAKFGVSYN